MFFNEHLLVPIKAYLGRLVYCSICFMHCGGNGRWNTKDCEENIRSEGEKEIVWGEKNREGEEKAGENRQGRKKKGGENKNE